MSTHFYFVQLAQVEGHFSVRPAQDSNWKNDISQLRNGLFHSVQSQSEIWNGNRVNRQNKKDPPKQVLLVAASPQPVSPAFYQVQASLAFTQDVDDVPEMLHRGSDGLHSFVVL